jgi:hypothetical protein
VSLNLWTDVSTISLNVYGPLTACLLYVSYTTCIRPCHGSWGYFQPLTAEAWVRDRVSPHEICAGQSGTGTGFSPNSSVFPVNIIPPWLSTLIHHIRDEQWVAVLTHTLTPPTCVCVCVCVCVCDLREQALSK